MAKDKKKDKKKKDKKSKDDGLSTVPSDASLAHTIASNTIDYVTNTPKHGSSVQRGQMFERYSKNGAMTPRAFLQMVQNEGLQPHNNMAGIGGAMPEQQQMLGGGMGSCPRTSR